MVQLSEQFRKTISQTGYQGQEWLKKLPDLIEDLSQRWQLHDLSVVANLSHNFVARAVSDITNTPVILKICIPSADFHREYKALTYFNGKGCVRLLASDETCAGLLLEDLQPGISAKAFFPQEDDRAIACAVEVIQKLQEKPFEGNRAEFTSLGVLCDFFKTFNHPQVPPGMRISARVLSEMLLGSQREVYLLHGDLHHENILLGSSGWVAIDPKGYLSERAFEIGAFMRNPWPELMAQQDPSQIIKRRFDLFSQNLMIDRQRLIDWTYVSTVLAACWALQDNQPQWRDFLRCALIIKNEKLSL